MKKILLYLVLAALGQVFFVTNMHSYTLIELIHNRKNIPYIPVKLWSQAEEMLEAEAKELMETIKEKAEKYTNITKLHDTVEDNLIKNYHIIYDEADKLLDKSNKIADELKNDIIALLKRNSANKFFANYEDMIKKIEIAKNLSTSFHIKEMLDGIGKELTNQKLIMTTEMGTLEKKIKITTVKEFAGKMLAKMPYWLWDFYDGSAQSTK